MRPQVLRISQAGCKMLCAIRFQGCYKVAFLCEPVSLYEQFKFHMCSIIMPVIELGTLL